MDRLGLNDLNAEARNLLDRQYELAREFLWAYAYRLAVTQRDEGRISLGGQSALNVRLNIANAFLDKASLNAWILFCDNNTKKNAHYERLVGGVDDNLTKYVVSQGGKILGTSNFKNSKECLNRTLLALSGVDKSAFKVAKESLKTYRNSVLAHSEDPEGRQFYFPVLLNIAKLMYGFFRIINPSFISINFDSTIVGLKKEFEIGFFNMANIICSAINEENISSAHKNTG